MHIAVAAAYQPKQIFKKSKIQALTSFRWLKDIGTNVNILMQIYGHKHVCVCIHDIIYNVSTNQQLVQKVGSSSHAKTASQCQERGLLDQQC